MGLEPLSVGRPASLQLELLELETLPCGCIAGDFRASALGVEIISLEAKGPLCLRPAHRVGETLELGDLHDDEPADLPLGLADLLDPADPGNDERMS